MKAIYCAVTRCQGLSKVYMDNFIESSEQHLKVLSLTNIILYIPIWNSDLKKLDSYHIHLLNLILIEWGGHFVCNSKISNLALKKKSLIGVSLLWSPSFRCGKMSVQDDNFRRL